MNEEINNKLGRDSVGKLLFNLAVPAITGQLVNLLYNIVDRIYIGHIPNIGANALTGVGLTLPIIMIIAAFSYSLIAMGGTPQAAIKMGQNKYDESEQILGNCFVVIIGISVILTLLFIVFGEKLLVMFGASYKTLPYALSFLNTYIFGTIFVQITLGLNSFISIQGFAKTSMISIVIGAALSIVLDPIFIFGFGMGVKGAALANVISQAFSAAWILKFLFGNKTKLKLRKKNMHLKKSIIIPVLILGISPFIMNSTESLLNIALNSSLQKYGGDIAVGAMTIISSLMQVLFLPLSGLSQGAQTIISFNYGAKKNDRVKKTFKMLIKWTVSVTFIYWILMMVFPRFFVSVFSNDNALIDKTVWAIRIYMATTFAMGLQSPCQQTFIALGQVKSSLFLALLRKIILLIPLIYILPNFFADKVFAVFLAEPISDFIAISITVIVFKIQFKKILAKNITPVTLNANITR